MPIVEAVGKAKGIAMLPPKVKGIAIKETKGNG